MEYQATHPGMFGLDRVDTAGGEYRRAGCPSNDSSCPIIRNDLDNRNESKYFAVAIQRIHIATSLPFDRLELL